MLRKVYLRLLQFHPPHFRERFSGEMVSIFDNTPGRMARAHLLGDGLLSVVRQWMLQPHYAQGSLAALPGGGLAFHVFHYFKPRTIALIEGTLLTAATFTFVCYTLGYNWRHPMLIPIKPPHWEVHKKPHARLYYPPIVEPLPTETAPSAPAQRDSDKTSHPAVAPANPLGAAVPAAAVPLDTLRSYTGTYAVETQEGGNVLITLANGTLFLHLPGHSLIALIPMSTTNFSASGDSGLWVAFDKPAGSRLQIHRDGHQFTARRLK